MPLTPILYDVWAELIKWPVEDRTPRTGDVFHPDRVYEGTLAGCIREFMQKPTSQRPLYEISTESQPAFSSTFLSAAQMLEIASRADFPKDELGTPP
jgi:hypothetical protein